MAFVELKPKKTVFLSKHPVKINFIRRSKNDTNKYGLMIRIKKDLADKIDLKKGDRVSFLYDEDDKRIWLIKKSDDFLSYKVGGDAKRNILTIQLTWDLNKLFEPNDDEFEPHYVRSDIYQEGIKINAYPITG